MGLKNFFGAKKKTELEKKVEEVQALTNKIGEYEGNLRDFNSAKKSLEIELRIDSSQEDLNKRLSKVVVAIEDTQSELEKAREKQQELNEEISKLKGDQRQQELNELAQQDVEVFMQQHKASLLNEELEKLYSITESRAGNINALTPRSLSRDAGVDRLDRGNPEHAKHIEIFDALKQEEMEKAKKEVDEILKGLKEYLGG